MRSLTLVLLLTICAGCGRARLVDPVYRDASPDGDATDGDATDGDGTEGAADAR